MKLLNRLIAILRPYPSPNRSERARDERLACNTTARWRSTRSGGSLSPPSNRRHCGPHPPRGLRMVSASRLSGEAAAPWGRRGDHTSGVEGLGARNGCRSRDGRWSRDRGQKERVWRRFEAGREAFGYSFAGRNSNAPKDTTQSAQLKVTKNYSFLAASTLPANIPLTQLAVGPPKQN